MNGNFKWHRYTNIAWLIFLLAATSAYIFCSIFYDYTLCSQHVTRIFNEIVVSTFSAAFLLLLFEIILYKRDQQRLGYLKGTYVRKYIVEMNEGGVRSNDLKEDQKANDEARINIKYLDDSKYHELSFFDCTNTEWLIELRYEFAGNYTGTIEYFKYGVKSPFEYPKPKTTAEINISLNGADRTTGSGSYQYHDREDYGIYKFQVLNKKNCRILVYYENVHPSGLAEGYEIWEKKIG